MAGFRAWGIGHATQVTAVGTPRPVELPGSADAVVIGAGPNGLVAGNVLADAGWEVVVLEANEVPGGAVRTEEVTAPGFRNDLFSAFYPLGGPSPVSVYALAGAGALAAASAWRRPAR